MRMLRLLSVALISAGFLACLSSAAVAQVNIIFDTDMDTDCDDVGALAMLHALADGGEANILATVVSSRYPWSVSCVAAINQYFGRGDLPIGCPKGEGVDTGSRGSRYARQIAEQFPVRNPEYAKNDAAPDAVDVYRRILAAQDDQSVVIVSVGYLTNLDNLLKSGGDKHSPLSGSDLVKQKVKLWVCMGGRYPKHLDPGVFGNFKPDPAAAVSAAKHWPGPVVFSGLGDDIPTGVKLRAVAGENPVRRGYDLYLGKTPARPSWDPISVLYAVRPNAEFWQVHRGGYNHIFENGTNEWRPGAETHQSLLQLQPGMKDKLRLEMETLMAAQPKAKK